MRVAGTIVSGVMQSRPSAASASRVRPGGGRGGSAPSDPPVTPPSPDAASLVEPSADEILDAVRDTVFVLDAGGRIVRLSAALERALGVSRNALLGSEFAVLLHPDDVSAATGLVRRALAGEDTSPLVVRSVGAAGEVVWAELLLRAHAIRGRTFVIGTGRDVGERLLAERREHVQLELSRQVAEGASGETIFARLGQEMLETLPADLVLVFILDHGSSVARLAGAHGSAAAHAVLPAEVPLTEAALAWLTRGPRAIVSEGEIARGLFPGNLGERLGVTGLVSVALQAEGQRRGFFAAVRFGGAAFDARSRRQGELLARALAGLLGRHERHEKQAVDAALGVCARELIAQLETEDLHDHLCATTRAALGADFVALFLLTEDRASLVQLAGAGLLARPREELATVRIPLDVIPEIMARLAREDVVALPTPLHDRLVPLVLREGWGDAAAIAIALRRGQELIGILVGAWREPRLGFSGVELGTARGLTGLAALAMENARRFEAVVAAGRLKTDFVATISHELRTPLNSLLGYSHLLLEGEFGPLDAEQRDVVARIERNAGRLHELIEQVLDLSRLEAGRLRPVKTYLRLRDVVAAASAAVAPLRRDDVELVVEVARDGGGAIGDAVKLRLVLVNLLQNALRYTPAGRVSLRVGREGSQLVVTVADTGVGIAPEHLERIFEPFRQLAPSLTRDQGGVGLGLYIVKRLVELMHGQVSVESTLGSGSTFRFAIPLEWVGSGRSSAS